MLSRLTFKSDWLISIFNHVIAIGTSDLSLCVYMWTMFAHQSKVVRRAPMLDLAVMDIARNFFMNYKINKSLKREC